MKNLVDLVVMLGRTLFGPFRWFRKKLIYAMLAFEPQGNPKKSIRWLLQLSDDIGYMIDRHCIRLGDGVHIKHEVMAGIHSFFVDRVPRGARVLDVGCGYGAVANALSKRGDLTVVGIDFNENHIRHANATFAGSNIKFVVGDATKDLPDEQFDAVVLSSVLEHVDERVELLKALTERYRPECVLIRVPMLERHYHIALKRMLGMFPYTDNDHKIEYTMDLFEEEMEAAQLNIDHCEVRWGDIWAQCSMASQEQESE